jgi:hypothetical protein
MTTKIQILARARLELSEAAGHETKRPDTAEKAGHEKKPATDAVVLSDRGLSCGADNLNTSHSRTKYAVMQGEVRT